MNNPIWINGKLQERFFTVEDHQAKSEGNDYPWQMKRRREGRSSLLIMSFRKKEDAEQECEQWNKHHSDDIEVPKF